MQLQNATYKLRQFFINNGRLPSYKELCDLFNYASKNAAYYLVNKLIEAEVIERDSKGKLIPKKLGLPLPQLGSIQAGFPTHVDDEIFESVTFDHYLVKKPMSSFLLRVSGDSMIEAGINEDDFVVIEKTNQPRQGDIVAACVENECTLKYFQQNNGQVALVPANQKYPTIYPKGNFKIYGKVVSLIRKYR